MQMDTFTHILGTQTAQKKVFSARQNRCGSTRGPAALFVAPLVEFTVPRLKG